jgi:fructose-bisphosphate aldolase class II
MKSLREVIADASARSVAVGHFNTSNLEVVHAIYNGAKSLDVPVIVGVSEGERDFTGVKEIAGIIRSIREGYGYPIYLNADHTYSVERAREAIDAGFDAVIFDGAELSLEDNIAKAKEVVAYARSCGRDVLVEGELGFIGKSSKVLDAVPDGVDLSAGLTQPLDAKRFVEETGVDLLAPAVGNFHGMLKGGVDPALSIETVASVRAASGVPLVLHGGSGNSINDFIQSIKAGIAVVHINTELRVAFRKALVLALQENPDEVSPYKYLKHAERAVEKVVVEKLKIFNGIN